MNKALENQGRHEKEVRTSQKLPSKESPRKTTSIITLIPILILSLVSCAVYFNALLGDFVYDDKDQVLGNPWIRDMRNIPTIFSKSVWGFQQGISKSNYYRPLMHTIYMLNYHFFGLKPWGFHLVNILFHCGVSVLVLLIIRRFLAGYGVSTSSAYLSPPFIAAMLFASHPIHTEAVAWIAGLPDVAFTFFYLLSLYLYIVFRDGLKRGYLWSVISFSAASLLKEPALTLPLMLIAYDSLLKKSDETTRARMKRYIPYVAVSGVYLLMRYYALRSLAPIESYPGLTTYQFVINIFPLFTEYLTSLLWPFHMNLWHTFHPLSSLFEVKGMIAIAVTLMFILAATAAYRKNKVLFFALLLFIVPLLPIFYIKGIGGKPFAERYLYLPSVGYVFLLAIFLSWARKKLPRAVGSVTVVLLVLAGFYAVATIQRNHVWRDDFNLWTDTVRKSPDNAIVRYHLGDTYKSKGLLDKAIAEYQIALRIQPETPLVHNNLGNAYASQGLLNSAIGEYQTALRLRSYNPEAHNNLGAAYASQGQWDRAIAEYQTALRQKPDYADAHNNLGAAYASEGLPEKAMEEFQTALRLEPDYADAHNNLGNVYASQGQMDKAIAEYRVALRLKPDHANAHYNLGAAYASQGLLDSAIGEYQIVLRLKPDHANAHYKLGLIYLKTGNTDMARREIEATLHIKPDFDEARRLLIDITSGRR